MRFNDATNKELSLYHDALMWAGAKELSFDITRFTRSANFALDAVLRKIYKADGRFQYDDFNNTDLPIATTDLVANKDHIPLEDGHLKVTRFRIKDKQGNWKTLKPVDRRELTDDQLNETGEPEFYDKLGNNAFMIPKPDYSAEDGAELQFQRGSNYFAIDDTTKEPGFPVPFHRYISLLPARDYVLSETIPNKLQPIDTEIQRLDTELVEFFAFRDRDERPRFGVKRTTEFY